MREIDKCDLDDRIDRLALNASEFFGGFQLSPMDGLTRAQTLLAKRIVADTAWLIAALPETDLPGVHDRILDRMRAHLGISSDYDNDASGGAKGVVFALKAGPVTLDKSDCGETLSGTSSFGGSATFASGATVTACIFTKDQKPIGGSVTGGWSCSF